MIGGKGTMTDMKNIESGITLQHVKKKLGKMEVLHDVTLQIPTGSIYGLLGPSGCGKSTTVKIMTGILSPDEGTTYVLGEKMPKLSVMKNIGYMAQAAALYPTLTAYENMKFFGSLYGIPKKTLEGRIQYLAELVNLKDDLHKITNAFSGGMKQRLSLAITLIAEPQVLILDEPAVGIDPVLRKSIWDELYRLSEQNVTILVTTHVMDEAEKCFELAMMRDGEILATGTPQEIKQKAKVDTIEEAFIYFGNSKEAGGRLK